MAEVSMVEKVARAIGQADLNASARSLPNVPMETMAKYVKQAADEGHYEAMARAAIEAMPVDEYYLRCAKFVEGVRETYGHGYDEGDIERMFRIFVARDLIFLKYNNASKLIAKAVDDAIDAIMRGETPPPAL